MLLLLFIHRGWHTLGWWFAPRRPTTEITDGAHVTLACPVCGSPQAAIEKIHERWSPRRDRCDERFTLFQCTQCQTQFNSNSCLEQADGTYTTVPWRCPLCQTENAPPSRQCANCHAGGANIG